MHSSLTARLSEGRFLQYTWQVQNHSIYTIICKVVGGKLQNGKDVFITDYVSRLQFLFRINKISASLVVSEKNAHW